MGTLIKVTSIPFESIRFTQNARLVPSDRVAAERQNGRRHYPFIVRTSTNTAAGGVIPVLIL